jgi:hypothetical protein
MRRRLVVKQRGARIKPALPNRRSFVMVSTLNFAPTIRPTAETFAAAGVEASQTFPRPSFRLN